MKTFAVRVFKNELKINFPHLVLHFLTALWQTDLYQDETVHERNQWHGL